VKHIVGVQFRNCATVGGSIYGRFGFSDVLTCFLALECYVELYKGGVVPLSEFVNMPLDNDVLVKIIIKKDSRQVAYLTHRRAATDFPVLACAVAKVESEWQVVIGARPARAKKTVDNNSILSQNPTDDEIHNFITFIEENMDFDSNMRGSKEYRKHLAGVLVKRGIHEIVNEGDR